MRKAPPAVRPGVLVGILRRGRRAEDSSEMTLSPEAAGGCSRPPSSSAAFEQRTYLGDVATHAVEFDDDFAALVARTRREMIAAGENRAPATGVYEPPFGADARQAI